MLSNGSDLHFSVSFQLFDQPVPVFHLLIFSCPILFIFLLITVLLIFQVSDHIFIIFLFPAFFSSFVFGSTFDLYISDYVFSSFCFQIFSYPNILLNLSVSDHFFDSLFPATLLIFLYQITLRKSFVLFFAFWLFRIWSLIDLFIWFLFRFNNVASFVIFVYSITFAVAFSLKITEHFVLL